MLVREEAPRARRQLVPSAEALMLVVLLAGVALLTLGAWMAWPPAGPLVAGAFLVVLALAWVRGGWASSTG